MSVAPDQGDRQVARLLLPQAGSHPSSLVESKLKEGQQSERGSDQTLVESNAAGASQHGEGLVETKPVGDDSNQYDPVGTTAVDEAVSQHSTADDVNEEDSASSEGKEVLQPRRQNEGSSRRRRADRRDQERHVMEMAQARMALRDRS